MHLVIQKDFSVAVECVKELVDAVRGRSSKTLAYQIHCAINTVSYGAYAWGGDGHAPGPVIVGSKLTVFLRWVLPIIKAWLEKVLPNVFGLVGSSATEFNPDDLKQLEEFLAMPEG